tara:strand:+ start:247 stop:435 length:189 start_codon:yes stop_codon:yes gene_type:complete
MGCEFCRILSLALEASALQDPEQYFCAVDLGLKIQLHAAHFFSGIENGILLIFPRITSLRFS